MNLIRCGGKYNMYPDNCKECSRYMDDCDGSGLESEEDE